MKNQSDESPRLVVLKLDNGELGEDLTHHDATTAGGPPASEDGHAGFEVVESHGLPDELVEGDPSVMSPGDFPCGARHPSTDQRAHPAQIEEEI
jgi:hypothetical protein